MAVVAASGVLRASSAVTSMRLREASSASSAVMVTAWFVSMVEWVSQGTVRVSPLKSVVWVVSQKYERYDLFTRDISQSCVPCREDNRIQKMRTKKQ